MAAKKGKSELITGVFTIVAIFALVAVVMYLQGFTPKVSGSRYTAVFEDVGGLSGSGKVIVAGQVVGRVDSIKAVSRTDAGSGPRVEIEVGFVIETDYATTVRIPVDTVAQVQAGGLFGGSDQIVLRLGKAKELVSDGGRLPMGGKRPVGMNDLFEKANQTLENLNKAVQKLTDVIGTDEFRDNLKQISLSLSEAAKRLDSGLKQMEPAFARVEPALVSAEGLLADTRKLITDNTASINALVKNFESASGRIDALLADKEGGVPELVRGLNHIAGNLDGLVANLNDLVLDNQLNFQVSMQNIRETTASLRTFARRIERDPSLLVWGDSEDEKKRAQLDGPKGVPNVDELSIRNSGRRPRKESD